MRPVVLPAFQGFSQGRTPFSRSATTRSVTRVYMSARLVEVEVFIGLLLSFGVTSRKGEPARSSSGDYTGAPPTLPQAGRMERAGAGRAEWGFRRAATVTPKERS